MVPPTIEALMDILEGSKDLTELLDNEVAQDVVEQTRGLEEQTVKKVRLSVYIRRVNIIHAYQVYTYVVAEDTA